MYVHVHICKDFMSPFATVNHRFQSTTSIILLILYKDHCSVQVETISTGSLRNDLASLEHDDSIIGRSQVVLEIIKTTVVIVMADV